MTSLNLKKFDMSKIGKGSVVIMIGKRNTGKFFYVRIYYIIKETTYWHSNISYRGANKFYSTMMPSLFIHEEFSPEIVNNLVKRQRLVLKKMQDQIDRCGNSKIDPWGFLILDDLMYDTSWVKEYNN